MNRQDSYGELGAVRYPGFNPGNEKGSAFMLLGSGRLLQEIHSCIMGEREFIRIPDMFIL